MEILHRVGTFFILVGLALLVIFVGSVLGKDVHGIYLLLALAAFLLAYLFRRNKPAAESGRFKTFRRVTRRDRQQEDEGNKDQKE